MTSKRTTTRIAGLLAVMVVSIATADHSYETDVVYGHKAGMALTYDVVKPAPEVADGSGVLFVVSGGWFSNWFPVQALMRGDRGRIGLFRRLVDAGSALYVVRHGSAPQFKVPDAVADLRLAWRSITQNAEDHGVDPSRVGVVGFSAGGHLSLMLGTDDTEVRPAAVAAFYPPTDLRGYVGPSEDFPALDFDPDLARDVSPIHQIDADDTPTLFLHGDADRLVPLRQSRRMHEALNEAGVETKLIVYEDAAHGFPPDVQSQAEDAVIEWFARFLSDADVEAQARDGQ